MTEIRAGGTRMKTAAVHLGRLARHGMEVMTKVRLNSMRSAAEGVWAPWWAELDPVIRRYTNQPPHEVAKITHDHERWPEFLEDPEAADLLAQELVIEVRPLPLSELLAAEKRAERKGLDFNLDPDGLGLLMGMGFIVDDVSGGESEEAEDPAPKKPARKRAKAKE